MAAVTMSMCVVVVVVSLAAVQLQPLAATLRIDAGATAAAALPLPLPVVGLMVSHRVHGGRLEDDPRQVAAGMDAAGVARAAVLTTVQQDNKASPYLGYGSLNSNHAACPPSSCAGKPGVPYLPEPHPCAKYFQCPSTPH